MCTEILQLTKDNAEKAFKEGTPEDKQLLSRLFPKVFPVNPLECVFKFSDVLDIAGENVWDYTIKTGMTRRQIREIVTAKLELIYEVFNGTWKADFSKKNESKHYPWFEYKQGQGFVLSGVRYDYAFTRVSPRLCGKSEAIVRHICKYFLQEYNDYLTA